MSDEVVSTNILGREWDHFKNEHHRQLKKARGSGEALKQAANALGKRLDPGDQQFGEKITCWVSTGFREEQLIESRLITSGNYELRVRPTPSAPTPECDGTIANCRTLLMCATHGGICQEEVEQMRKEHMDRKREQSAPSSGQGAN